MSALVESRLQLVVAVVSWVLASSRLLALVKAGRRG